VKGALGRARRRRAYRRLQKRMAGPRLLEAFARTYPRASFVEIGANDGEQHDHLRPYLLRGNWRGVMVEPVPYVFERLRRNYAGVEGVEFENAAIAVSDGRLPFFHLRDADAGERAELPDWYDGVGSFSREAILTHSPQMPDIAERIVEVEVPALRFATLCDRHGIERPDLVVIDTEGHDWEIVRTIDLAARGPRMLVYEHFHLTPGDRAACRGHLEEAGYETMEEGFDTVCLRPDDDELTRRFRRLTPAVAGVAKYEEER
jgi:FkbM family methyltransferase